MFLYIKLPAEETEVLAVFLPRELETLTSRIKIFVNINFW